MPTSRFLTKNTADDMDQIVKTDTSVTLLGLFEGCL